MIGFERKKVFKILFDTDTSTQGGNNGLQDFKRLPETPRDFNKRDFKISKDCEKTLKYFKDFDRLRATSKELKRLQNIFQDFIKLQEIP